MSLNSEERGDLVQFPNVGSGDPGEHVIWLSIPNLFNPMRTTVILASNVDNAPFSFSFQPGSNFRRVTKDSILTALQQGEAISVSLVGQNEGDVIAVTYTDTPEGTNHSILSAQLYRYHPQFGWKLPINNMLTLGRK